MNVKLKQALLTIAGSGVFLMSAQGFAKKEVAKPVTGIPAPMIALVEGKNYRILKPSQPVSIPKKIEVLEFFWYGCGHCYAFEPYFESWKSKQKLEVAVRKVPASFGGRLEPHQRLFFALEAIGKSNLNGKIFEGIHKERLRLETPEEMTKYLAKFGVNPKTFLDAYNSFAVKNKVAQATKMEKDYQIDGVPTVAVQGVYITSPSMAGDAPTTLKVLDALVARAKASLK